MPQPILRTERLVLEPLGDEHLDHEIALDGDPEVMRYLGDGVPNSREHVVEAHARRLSLARTRDGAGLWAGRHGDAFVGWWLLDAEDAGPDEIELGYRLRREFWRRGFAREGSRELLLHAFVELGVQRVFAQTMFVNEGSRATMTSLGMRHVRTFHEQWPVPIAGSEHGEVEYELTREDWLKI